MTVTNSYTNQTSNSTLYTENSNITSDYSSNLYLGSGSTNVPGLSNIFFAPYDLYHEMNALSAAYKIDDREAVVDKSLKTMQTPFSFSNALMQFSVYVINAGVFLKTFDNAGFAPILALTSPLSKLITATGFVICMLEGLFESLGLARSAELYKDIYLSDKEELKNKFVNTQAEFLAEMHRTYLQISSDEMQEIDDYVKNKLSDLPEEKQNERKNLIIQSNLEVKKSALIRRVQPWLANRIEETLPQILENVYSPYRTDAEEAKEKVESLFNNIKIQTEKNLLIYSVGLLAVLFTIAGLLAQCIVVHFVIPVILLGIGGILAISRGLMYLGLKDTEGWDFSVENCIPDTIKTIYNNAIAERAKITNEPYCTLSYSYTLPGSAYDIALRDFAAESFPVLKFPSLKDYGIVL